MFLWPSDGKVLLIVPFSRELVSPTALMGTEQVDA
jgi:hypothetical protein